MGKSLVTAYILLTSYELFMLRGSLAELGYLLNRRLWLCERVYMRDLFLPFGPNIYLTFPIE